MDKTKKGKIKIFFKQILSYKNKIKYADYVMNSSLNKSKFVPIAFDDHKIKSNDKKLIAYYLPQFYQIPQNDKWHGRGFTEWDNCVKVFPQWAGHWQPHLPIDVGFYNLETVSVMHRQIELAKKYGISGFCFYYYWFSGGEKIMEKPINNFLKDKTLNFPFMLFWANEDWTNTWGEKEDKGTKVYEAKMKDSDVQKFADDIIPFFEDKRYIRIQGRPMLIIYQSLKDKNLPKFIIDLGKALESKGSTRPYVMLVFPDENPEIFDPYKFNADAAVEFGVHMKNRINYLYKPIERKDIINPLAKIQYFDMTDYILKKVYESDTAFPTFNGVMTTFDNTARKIYSGAYLFDLSPSLYKQWLGNVLQKTKQEFVFISAWNEWAEGMHLEPDQRFGYAYLQATRDALEERT
jgi:hypothetical protein